MEWGGLGVFIQVVWFYKGMACLREVVLRSHKNKKLTMEDSDEVIYYIFLILHSFFSYR